MSLKEKRSIDRGAAFQQKLIHDPIVFSEKYLGQSSNPASIDSHYTFKASIQSNILRKNPTPADSTSSRVFSDVARKPSYDNSVDNHGRVVMRKSFYTSDLTQKSRAALKDNPFENSYLRNQMENLNTHVSGDHPDDFSFRPNTGSTAAKGNLKIRDFSITMEQFKNAQNPPKSSQQKPYGTRDKVLRMAALKYFNTFESLAIKRAERERLNQSAFVNPSGHILLDRPKTHSRTPIRKRIDPFVNISKNTNPLPELLKKIRSKTPIVFESRPLYDIPNKIGPTRITYVEQLERKYQHLFEEETYPSNTSYYY
jgi:hypothetical protein